MGDAWRRVLEGEKLSSEERRALDWGLATQEVAAAESLDELALDQGDDELSGGDALFPRGYHQIVAHLARGLDVRLGHVVKRIDATGGAVKVSTARGDFEAKRVLVTLPLGVLQAGAVQFAPALSAAKLQALKRMGMGVLNKVALQFSRTFWPTGRGFLGYLSERKGEFPVYLDARKFSDAHLLMAFTGGEFARSLEKRSDAEVVKAALAPLKKMFGPKLPEPTGFQVARWGADPFAYGSYSHLRPGGDAADRDALAEPLAGKVYFAGEATHRQFPGTVHGALLSGQREADRLLGG